MSFLSLYTELASRTSFTSIAWPMIFIKYASSCMRHVCQVKKGSKVTLVPVSPNNNTLYYYTHARKRSEHKRGEMTEWGIKKSCRDVSSTGSVLRRHEQRIVTCKITQASMVDEQDLLAVQKSGMT